MLELMLCSLLLPAAAMFEEQAGQYDWHKENIGRVTHAVMTGGKAYVATESNVVAGLDTKRGRISWRQILEDNPSEKIVSLLHHQKMLVTLSEPKTVRVWNTRDGSLVWASDSSHAQTNTSHLSTPLRISVQSRISGESPLASSSAIIVRDADARAYVAVLSGRSVTLYDLIEPTVIWEQKVDAAIEPLLLSAAAGRDGDRLLLLASSTTEAAQQQQHKAIILTLDVQTGAASPGKPASRSISSPLGAASAVPGGFAFIDAQGGGGGGTLVVLRPGQPDAELSFSGLGSEPRLQASLKSDAVLLHDATGTKTHLCALSSGSDAGSDALTLVATLESPYPAKYSFVRGAGASRLRVARAYADADAGTLSSSVYDLAEGPSGASSPSETLAAGAGYAEQGGVYAVYAQFLKKSGKYRALVVSETHALSAVGSVGSAGGGGGVMWTREEALASVVGSEMVSLPLASHLVQAAASTGHFPSFAERLRLQADGLVEALGDLARGTGVVAAAEENLLESDHFGLRKLIVVLSATGKMFGLSTTRGETVWQRRLVCPSSSSSSSSSSCVYSGMEMVSNELALVYGTSGAHSFCTVIETLTGNVKDSRVIDRPIDVLAKMKLHVPSWKISTSSQPISTSSATASRGYRTFLLAHGLKGENPVVALLPPTSAAVSVFEAIRQKLVVHSIDVFGGTLKGFAIKKGGTLEGGYPVEEVWTVSFPVATEKICDIKTIDPDEIVHSPVSGMGDGRAPRRKYLNPSLIALATQRTGTEGKRALPGVAYTDPSIVIYLIDGITGKIIHRRAQKFGQGPVHLAIAENMVVAHYFNSKSNTFEITTIELYEDPVKTAKAESAALAAESSARNQEMDPDPNADPVFSSLIAPVPTLIQRTYLFTKSITTLAVAKTRQGITSKLVLTGLSSHQIAGIGRNLLDARRPYGEAPPTKDQMADGIVPYHPVLKLETQKFPSYNTTVARVAHITTAPTFLESTSLVFAHGLDLFYTRVTPSGAFDLLSEDFNRPFLAATVSGVIVLLGLTRRWSRQKRLSMLWM